MQNNTVDLTPIFRTFACSGMTVGAAANAVGEVARELEAAGLVVELPLVVRRRMDSGRRVDAAPSRPRAKRLWRLVALLFS
jgi:hypothetical protein